MAPRGMALPCQRIWVRPDRWLSYYRACGIDAICVGAVLVRKRGGVNWFQGSPSARRCLAFAVSKSASC
ncbi:MAG: hypothetical protein Udaeo2_28520 [Candidatus Udaeobacter sp.]|nr:MAG: hypothetical protein Udaeo2_28520 [Candidatus Udaeobacter sp.]